MSVIQRNIRKWLSLKNWQWWKLYTRVKPLLSLAHAEDEMRAKEEEYRKTKEELEKITDIKKQLEEQNITLTQAKNDLYLELQSEQVSYIWKHHFIRFNIAIHAQCTLCLYLLTND